MASSAELIKGPIHEERAAVAVRSGALWSPEGAN
jgi:hypothetical protein